MGYVQGDNPTSYQVKLNFKPIWKPDRKILPTARGRNNEPAFTGPEEFYQAISEFIDWCKENGQHPSVERFGMYCGLSRQSVYWYGQQEGYKEIYDVFKNLVFVAVADGAMSGNLNVGMAKLILKDQFGLYYEKPAEGETQTGTTVIQIVGTDANKDS